MWYVFFGDNNASSGSFPRDWDLCPWTSERRLTRTRHSDRDPSLTILQFIKYSSKMNEYLLNIQIFILWANYTTRQQCALVDNSVKSGWKASYSVCILAASSEEELGVKASQVSTNKLLQWVSGQLPMLQPRLSPRVTRCHVESVALWDTERGNAPCRGHLRQ